MPRGRPVGLVLVVAPLLAVAGAGCLLPPPAQFDTTVHDRPAIVFGDPDFFGEPGSLSYKLVFSDDANKIFRVRALDANPDIAVLHARLILQKLDRTFVAVADSLMAPDPSQPGAYSAQLVWGVCRDRAVATGRDHALLVYVSDGGFTSDGTLSPDAQALGAWDWKGWVIRCE